MTTYRQPFVGSYPITQHYGEKVTSDFHTGIDYYCPVGTAILASADGEVMFAAFDYTGYGYTVILKHVDGKATLYAHLSRIVARTGQSVQQSEVIGYSGNTGNSTGPHLHFEARSRWNDYKSHQNPITYLPLMSIDDSINTEREPESTHPVIPEGPCRIICDYAFIRDWNLLTRDRLLNKGEIVYAFKDVKHDTAGLPFRFIGANRCIAEYDSEGTQILESINGKEN